MKLRSAVLAAAVTAALAGLAGCDRADSDRVERTTPPPAPATSTKPATPPPATADRGVGQTLDDAGITAKVKAALLAEKGVNGTAIDVDTMQGKVTLTGKVPDQSQVDRATQVARGIEGVKDVDNRLTVGTS
jgi:hyperosmotically inducible protein